MASKITVTTEDIRQIENRLKTEKSALSAEDAALLEAVLRKARKESDKPHVEDGQWAFSWTYHF
jgi:hypothetical protein